jgi:hypothetical protein
MVSLFAAKVVSLLLSAEKKTEVEKAVATTLEGSTVSFLPEI